MAEPRRPSRPKITTQPKGFFREQLARGNAYFDRARLPVNRPMIVEEEEETIEDEQESTLTEEERVSQISARRTSAEQAPVRQTPQRQTPESESPVATIAGAVRDKTQETAKNLAKKVAGQAAKKAALAATVALGEFIGPIVIGLVILLIVVFLLIGLVSLGGGNDIDSTGTSTVQAFDQSSTADLNRLSSLLSKGVNSANNATALLTETAKYRISLSDNPEAIKLLDSIDSAAKEIINSPSPPSASDLDKIKANSQKIKADITALIAILGGDCNQATVCLNVPGVKESQGGHCGTASILMVLRYLNGNDFENRYYDSTNNQTASHPAGSCPLSSTLESAAPADRKGWIRASWADSPADVKNIGKEALFEAIKRSLRGSDPVIIYLNGGAIYPSKHIVTIVGYSESTDTFYINDPFPGGFRLKVNTAGRDVGNDLLTSVYLKNYVGGDGLTYPFSVIIRKQYVAQ